MAVCHTNRTLKTERVLSLARIAVGSAVVTEGDILLVEDDPDISLVLALVLGRAGLVVTQAGTLHEALAAQRRREGSFDAIVADKNLPDGSGIQLLEFERSRAGDAELVVISGFPSLDSAVAALRLGAYDYIEKPFRNLDDVVATVTRAVRHRKVRRERDEARARALRAERAAVLVRVAAGIAHEVKNPLQGMNFATANIRLALDAGSLPSPLAADLREQVALIEAESRRLRELVEGVLDLARPAPRPAVDIDLARLLNEVTPGPAARLASQGGVLHVRVSPGAIVRADEADLARAIDNVIRNAVEASPAGAEVTVNVIRDELGRIEIAVEDRGTGFAPESKKSAFEPFFTTKARGFGLGLCQVSAAAERAGATVAIEDAVPHGARVVFRFPPAGVTHG